MSGYKDAPGELVQRVATLGDAVRGRLLAVLSDHELTVGELCTVVQLPQSTVSRHLKALLDARWVAARSAGTHRHYRFHDDPGEAAAQLWRVLREEVERGDEAAGDLPRLAEVLAQRRSRSRSFFSESAARWDELRVRLFGDAFSLRAMLALLDPGWVVADLGCGTGQLSEEIAPMVARVIAVDDSRAMLDAARGRLERFPNVEINEAALEDLPLAAESVDLVLLFLVLHHAASPVAVLREAMRVLKPGGRMVLSDMAPHSREEFRLDMGHHWLGFAQTELREMAASAGFRDLVYRPIRPDTAAQGPNLFTAVATRPARSGG